MKYWEIIADNLSKAGWSWGCVATVNSNGRTFAPRTASTRLIHVFVCSRTNSLTCCNVSARLSFSKRKVLWMLLD
jgi:hypothetical protein